MFDVFDKYDLNASISQLSITDLATMIFMVLFVASFMVPALQEFCLYVSELFIWLYRRIRKL